ncbi:MAG: calcium-binding protein [Sphingomonadaceae bacterium]|nr:calcium-binding protein [Sphingomonadaceae bacterium]
MATPVEWLGNFQANTGTAATGTQSDPHIIGLANGNILVAWTESADGAVGTTNGADIIGKIYDSEGNVIRDSYRLNSNRTADDETDFDIAATNDGGFVMVYVDDDISDVNQTTVIWERFDSNGDQSDVVVVADELVAADDLSNPQVAVDLVTNLSFITYTDDVGADVDISGNTVTDAGVLGTEFAAAQNSAEFDRNGDVAVLSNGNFVSVYEEDDAGTTSIEAMIMTSAGAVVTAAFTVTAGTASTPKVASLAGGGFVVVWNTANDILYQVFDNAGVAVTGDLTAASGADLQNEPDVVALVDGGFVISWDDDTDLHTEAARFTAAGVLDGGQFTIQATDGTSPDLGLTADGRILSVSRDLGGAGQDIFASIWDPRGAIVNAGDYDNSSRNFLQTFVITGGPGATTINGDGSDETLLGQGGNDTVNGGSGTDSIRGGGGADVLLGGFEVDNVDGGGGNDTIRVLDGQFGDNADGGLGTDTLDLSNVLAGGGEEANIDLGAGTWTSTFHTSSTITGIEVVLGTQGNDTLKGNNSGGVTLDGGLGDDRIDGTLNGQVLLGGDGADTIFASELVATGVGDSIDGGFGADSLVGGGGDDTIVGGSGSDVVDAGDGNDSVDGGFDGDTLLGGLGNDTIFAHAGLTSVIADSIIGAGGDDSLTGATANDTLQGGSGFDVLSGREGDDLMLGAGDDDTLDGGIGFDSLDGGNGNDSLTGGGGSDTLQGGGDADTLNGGGAIDFADYSAASAKVIADLKSPSNNTNSALGDVYVSIENLRGTALRDKLAGDDEANRLEGLAENDQLNGRDGADTLVGGGGKDRLKGGEDADQFVLNDLSLKDKILDFESGIDEIALDGGVFGLAPGALDPNVFVIGTAAGDANDRIIYDAIKGKLYFDADGTGAGAQVRIANLSGDPSLAASDFIVI